MAIGVNNLHLFIDNRFTGFHGGAQAAAFLANVGFENVLAQLADGFLFGNAGYFFRCPVERGYLPILIDRENTIGNRIEDNILPVNKIEGQRIKGIF